MQITCIDFDLVSFGTKKKFKKSFKTCAYCGGNFAPKNTRTIDHIRAKINGGTNDICNKIIVCAKCNRDKSGDSLKTYIEKHPSVEGYLKQSIIDHAGQIYSDVVWADEVKKTLEDEIGRDIFA